MKEHQYLWNVDENNNMTIWEDDCILTTVEECTAELETCFDEDLEELFYDIVFEMRNINLKEDK